MIPLVHRKYRENGQELVEVALTIGLVALVIISATALLSPVLRSYFYAISNAQNDNNSQGTIYPTQPPIPTQSPIPTQTPTWGTCAGENSYCSFSGNAIVRYGANDTWVSGTYTDGVLCSNSVFGDPLNGIVKSCQVLLFAPVPVDTATPTPIPTDTATSTPIPTATATPTPVPTWTTCAVENGYCSFSGVALVRYGANSTWASGTYTNGVLCANSVFGDPLNGTVKSCQIYR